VADYWAVSWYMVPWYHHRLHRSYLVRLFHTRGFIACGWHRISVPVCSARTKADYENEHFHAKIKLLPLPLLYF